MKLCSCSIVSQIVTAWPPGAYWSLNGVDSSDFTYYAIQLQNSTVSDVAEVVLYSAMENVSSNGAICNLPHIIGDLECEWYIQGI